MKGLLFASNQILLRRSYGATEGTKKFSAALHLNLRQRALNSYPQELLWRQSRLDSGEGYYRGLNNYLYYFGWFRIISTV